MWEEAGRERVCARVQVFAYGQTGSGKTYTMGTAATYRQMSSGEEGDGIIPRSIRFIFDSLADIQGAYDVSVKVHMTATSHNAYGVPLCAWLWSSVT